MEVGTLTECDRAVVDGHAMSITISEPSATQAVLISSFYLMLLYWLLFFFTV